MMELSFLFPTTTTLSLSRFAVVPAPELPRLRRHTLCRLPEAHLRPLFAPNVFHRRLSASAQAQEPSTSRLRAASLAASLSRAALYDEQAPLTPCHFMLRHSFFCVNTSPSTSSSLNPSPSRLPGRVALLLHLHGPPLAEDLRASRPMRAAGSSRLAIVLFVSTPLSPTDAETMLG
uniref:Uncharacterized protein n=1 Tax=Mycena chlorophos TaxID=658473 RepID=A0ABQ0L4A4_MYCCL|nr:predicted protein [Mycena chlorophos]